MYLVGAPHPHKTDAQHLDALLGVVDEVHPIEREDVQRAVRVLEGLVVRSARDAIHVAVMERRGVDRILSFDRAFDRVPGIQRIG